jgi:hypothetical protein
MNEHDTSFEADPASHEPSWGRPKICAHCGAEPDSVDDDIRMLGWMTEMGRQLTEVKLVRARRVLESEDLKDSAGDRSDLEYFRLSRAIRLNIALKNTLRNERAGRAKDAAAEQESDQQERKKRRKKQVDQAVGQAIEKQAEREFEQLIETDAEADEQPVIDRREALYETLSERLEEDDIEQDLLLLPTGELVKRICQDLGIEAAMELWRNSRWAREEAARAKPPGSPCTTPPAPEAPEPGPEAAEPLEPEPVAADSENLELPDSKPEAPATSPLRTNDRMREGMRAPEDQRAEEEGEVPILPRYYGSLDTG